MPKDWNQLPGVPKWDGNPHFDFRITWWKRLRTALGGIVQDHATLLATALGTDPGHGGVVVPAPAAGAAGPAAVTQEMVDQHNLRNARLWACIIEKIEPRSRIYQTLSAAPFQNAGRATYNFIYEEGHLARDTAARQNLLNEWEEMTINNSKIPYDENTLFNWLQKIEKAAEILNKGLQPIRKKFLDGLPPQLNYIAGPERIRTDDGSYVLPANFPAHHPNAGAADPNAGRPDNMKMARVYTMEWCRLLSVGAIKAPPKGSVNSVSTDIVDNTTTSIDGRHFDACNIKSSDEPSSSTDSFQEDVSDSLDEDILAVARERINETFICTTCGGFGHASVVGQFECLTKKLNIKIPAERLRAIQYPDGLKFPTFTRNANLSRNPIRKNIRPAKGITRLAKPRHRPAVRIANEQHSDEDQMFEEIVEVDNDPSLMAVGLRDDIYITRSGEGDPRSRRK